MQIPNIYVEETPPDPHRIEFHPATAIMTPLERGFDWVAFEENGPTLWAKIKAVAEDYLMQVWRGGFLVGTSVKEAYFVRCDRSTMTQIDLDQHKAILLIGMAFHKPAEFEILRIEIQAA